MLVNTLTRIGLSIFETGSATHPLSEWLAIFAVGFLLDLIAASFLLIPFALLAFLVPNSPRGRRIHGAISSLLFLFALVGMAFVVVTEALFWNEFTSRFNFIAVDYLIYSREVLGNIRESYPLGKLFLAIGVAVTLVFLAVHKRFYALSAGDGGSLLRRVTTAGAIIALPIASFTVVDERLRDFIAEPSGHELSGNGYYDFMHAFRANDLDYASYYAVIPKALATITLQGEFSAAKSTATFTNAKLPIEHDVVALGKQNKLNVVLVSMESHGADFVGALGDTRGLSPSLDQLAKEGLFFTQIYATGLRTVRGLEALTLSLPPTPGHSVLMRHNNKGMATFGGVLRDQGYDALYLYGGYSYFDNMRDFFSGNDYEVIDRTALAAKDITHENVWGVADEDIFRQAIRELDARTAAGKKVFAHVMTTSNHRPFTYPAKRIDIPPGQSREGAAKYADWAVGQFIREAKSHSWFDDTVFIFIADHTSHGRGRMDLPPENYHIPMIIYAPKWIKPAQIDYVASQIDVAPTVLSLLNFSYRSKFFGHDILSEGRLNQRAFMANYLTVGYMENEKIVELGPKRKVRVVSAKSGVAIASGAEEKNLTQKTISYYQTASETITQTSHR
ncbi:MAG: sulfatase-like hydrolase/transferase [Burkholderiales bacterium]